MNKRSIVALVLAAVLALPAAALGAAPAATAGKMEFLLGGYIRMQGFWDSTQEGKNANTLIVRNNNFLSANNFHHGRMKFTAQSSRFNFTIKGPKLWGATTTGFIEIDFDQSEAGNGGAANSASASYTPRLRHALFRLNWPATELLLGQYFSMFSRWYPDLVQDGPFQITGTPTARLAQIRLTQKFASYWTAGLLVGEPNSITNGQSYSGNDRGGGESTETPQIQGKLEFARDLWGKAAWYGKPIPFTIEVVGGWQRGFIQEGNRAFLVTGQDGYNATVGYTKHTSVNPWVIAGNVFIPVIPTHSANLAGTASILTNWWIGQAPEAFGWISFGSQVYRFNTVDALGRNVFDVDLMTRFGGQVQVQYYFTNQWYVNAAWGMSKTIGVSAYETDAAAALAGVPGGRKNVLFGDAANYHNEVDLALWFRPITAVKFGLQYGYGQTNYIQRTTIGSNIGNVGNAHNVRFVGLFFF